MARLLLALFLLLVVTLPLYFLFLKPPPPLPQVELDEWWGPESERGRQNEEVKSFRIKFTKTMIEDLKNSLKLTKKFVPPLEGIKHEYGFNSNEIATWVQYWRQEYNFEERQKFFNQYSHYKTSIQGLKIHFMHVKPEVPAGTELVPVLLLHGWPGSVREFYEAIPHLTALEAGRDFALELVIPSLPGYGFSDPAARPGMGALQVAVIMRNLMQRLGYQQYYVQGGDWGSLIGANIATLFPNEVLGFHTNLAVVQSTSSFLTTLLMSVYPPLFVDPDVETRMFPLSRFYSFMAEETGYMHLQATKPDTIGVALTESPAGLLAYILEKFGTWTDHNQAGLLQHFTREKLVDNLMVYWSTNSITTAMRLYSESFNKKHFAYNLDEIPTPVPTWAIQAKYELSYTPPFIMKFKYPNLLGNTVLQDGGHFLALQLPEIFSKDVIKAVKEFRKWRQSGKKTEL